VIVAASVPVRLGLLLAIAAALGGCTPTRSTIGGYTDEELARVAQQAREDCEGRRGVADIPPYPFTTDGCSLWPDGAWQTCCVDHDTTYWCGGGAEARREADALLRDCVARESAGMAALIWAGVRAAGVPWLPVPWRWGYGWPWPRGYDETR
jgi:hypothetical protein